MERAIRVSVAAASVVAFGMLGGGAFAQAPAAAPAGAWMSATPTNDLPNPYNTIEGFAKLPEGRTWGSTSAVEIDKDGRSIWVAERCAVNSCWDRAKGEMSPLHTVFKFDPNGKMVTSFGQGMFVFPHGIHVDRDGNIWVTDGQSNLPARAPGAPADAPLPAMPAKVVGHQVVKFSPEGKVLLTLGKPGGNIPGQPADPASFYQPNDVITYPNGDILVAEGHGNAAPATARLIRFDRTGKFIREYGKMGSGLEGEFMQPHGLAFDSKGRLFVADRSNNRIQILDPETFKTLDTWYQFSRLSGIFIDPRTDTHLRRRLRVRLGEPAALRVEARHPHRQRARRQGHRVHSRSVAQRPDLRDGRWQGGREDGRRQQAARRHARRGRRRG